MEDQLHNYFKDTDFDIDVPRFGHLDRFEKRLNPETKQRRVSLKWMSVAASVILLIGFWLGSTQTPEVRVLSDVSPQMQETESFFVSTIAFELKEVEKFRSPKTERIIEDALNQLEHLEDNYKELVKALNSSHDDRRVVYAMISNYQSRINILQDVLKQIDQVNNLKENNNDEIYI